MQMKMLERFVVVFASMLSLLATSAVAVDFRLVGQLDTAALNAGVPGSVAAFGNDVYVGGLFSGGQLHRINDPLGVPVNANTFGGFTSPPNPTTNGYVSLHTDGTTLVAATNNGGDEPDVVQVYTVGTDALNWESDSMALGITGDRIDGAAVDPGTGEVLITAFGSGTQHLFLPTGPPTPGTADVTPSVLFDNTTGWRDVTYDRVTGDLYLRATAGVNKGVRDDLATHDYTRPDGFGAGIQSIVPINDGFDSAINVEHLPASFAGQNLLIVNRRGNTPDTFADKIELYDADAMDASGNNSPIAAQFFLADGVTPFTTADAMSGIYDFSYDPINDVLYVSDFSTSQVHIFDVGAPPQLACDFDGDTACNGDDIDMLVENIAIGPANPGLFDLTGDGMVNLADRDEWLALAGAENLPSGNSYLLGDADLDGNVNGQDFVIWNNNKFTSIAAWTAADFNADGDVNGGDFVIWNNNKFMSADGLAAVPEPSSLWILGLSIMLYGGRRRA